MGMSPITGLSESMSKILQARVEFGYRQFIQLVARGRDMDIDAVEEIAQGRVWSGEVATEIGLVDGLGDLQAALEQAAQLAGVDDWQAVTLRRDADPRSMLLQTAVRTEGSGGHATAGAAGRGTRLSAAAGQVNGSSG